MVITEMSAFTFIYNTINITILPCSIISLSGISSNSFYQNEIIRIFQGISYFQEYDLLGENKGSYGKQIMYNRKEIFNSRMKTYKLLSCLKHSSLFTQMSLFI